MSFNRQYGADSQSSNNNPSYYPYRGEPRRSGSYTVSSGPSYSSPHIDRSHTASPPSPQLAPLGGHPGLPAFHRYNSGDSQGQHISPSRSNEDPFSSNPGQQHHHHTDDPVQHQQPTRMALPTAPTNARLQETGYTIPAPPPLSRGLTDRSVEMEDSGYHLDTFQDTSYRPQQQQQLHQDPYAMHNSPPSPPRHAAQRPSPYASPSPPYNRGHRQNQSSYSSTTGLAYAASEPAMISADHLSTHSYSRSHSRPESFGRGYSDYPLSHSNDSRGDLGSINPMEIADDDQDDGFNERRGKRRGGAAGGAAAAAAGAGGFLKGITSRNASGNYGQVPGGSGGEAEKGAKQSDWLSKETKGGSRLKWMVGGLIILVIVLAIVGGVVGAVITSKNSPSSSSSGGSSAADGGTGSDLNKNSQQVQSLLNNPNLHKVFPGMDYTPLNAMYPDCLTNPPSQNNITLDVAVLSQLTDEIRLYGTDCGQVGMTMQAIKNLELQDTKVWLGVWQDNNATTNKRQLQYTYDALDKWGADGFAGIIVGNEVLFREDMTEAELIDVIQGVRDELQKRSISLPVATSDLGSKWSPTLTAAVDIVMGNIHPFFGGVAAPQAATWTWQFWDTNNAPLTAGTTKKNIISEVGWPSQGGNLCTDGDGTKVNCTSGTAGSVAGIDEMNLFMSEWVCQSVANKTDYFWFEAFDEPWKIRYDTPTEGWEDHWGLFDINRNLKDGLKIPSCS